LRPNKSLYKEENGYYYPTVLGIFMVDEVNSHAATYAPNGVLNIRKSMLEDYGFCPRRFKITWIDGRQRQPNQAMLLGTRFHDFAERFFGYALIFPQDRWYDFIPKTFIQEEQEMATWFIDTEIERYEMLKSEERLDEFLPFMTETKLSAKSICVEGTIDRVDWLSRKHEKLIAIEYKTGKSINDDSITKQLALYAMMYHAMRMPGEIVGLRLINPRLKVIKDYKLERWHTDKALKEIIKLRDALKMNNFTPKCTDVKFAWCKMCSPEESGIKDGYDDTPFSADIVRNPNFKFSDIYRNESL
jgi:hypothetical protein